MIIQSIFLAYSILAIKNLIEFKQCEFLLLSDCNCKKFLNQNERYLLTAMTDEKMHGDSIDRQRDKQTINIDRKET